MFFILLFYNKQIHLTYNSFNTQPTWSFNLFYYSKRGNYYYSDKQVSIKLWLLQSVYYEVNNNRRRESTETIFLYFFQITAVAMVKLIIGNEQKLHEGRPYMAEPLFDRNTSPSQKKMSLLNDPHKAYLFLTF